MSAMIPLSKVGNLIEGCTKLARLATPFQDNSDAFRIPLRADICIDINFSQEQRYRMSVPIDSNPDEHYNLTPSTIVVWSETGWLIWICGESAKSALSEADCPEFVEAVNGFVWRQIKNMREAKSI